MRRHTARDSSEDAESSSSAAARPTQGIPSLSDRDSSASEDHGGQSAPFAPDVDVVRALRVLQRQMVHNFRDLHDGLGDTNRRLDELQGSTDRRFVETQGSMDQRFDEMQGSMDRRFDALQGSIYQIKAQQVNRGATHINNPIQPVGREDGMPIPIALSDRYKRVHEFLRLKRRDQWPVLASLLRFYGSESWPTWGLMSLSPADESDEDEPLAVHDSLETAISWAPEIALQDLARHIGLDYDKIAINVSEYEKLRQGRTETMKRTVIDEPAPSKRGKAEVPEQREPGTTQVEKARKSPSTDPLSGIIGWDTRATEDRTPDSRRPHIRDAPPYRQPTLSPTSAATSDAQLPTRAKT